MKKYFIVIYFCISSVWAAEPVDALRLHLKALHSMQASFKQTVREGGNIIQTAKGMLYLQRPGKFRWQQKQPLPQLIVSNGKTLWIFDEDLEQVSIKKLDNEIQGTPAFFLSGYDEQLARDYQVSQEVSDNGDNSTFKLTVKPNIESSYRRLILRYKKQQLVSLELVDKLGQTTQLFLSHIQLNQTISDKLFTFTPPKGVDIVHQ